MRLCSSKLLKEGKVNIITRKASTMIDQTVVILKKTPLMLRLSGVQLENLRLITR